MISPLTAAEEARMRKYVADEAMFHTLDSGIVGTIAGLLALVDREREAGIDADRLGRAIHAANDHKGPYCLFDDIEAAKDIAAEYARLRSGSPAPEGGE